MAFTRVWLLAAAAAALALFVPGAATTATPTLSPAVLASTYLGGPDYDTSWVNAVDASGNVYVAGDTWAAGFPVTSGALQTQFGGGGQDAFVAKFDRNGTLLWSTLLGGTGWDGIYGLKVDAAGRPVVTGVTNSLNFPVKSAIQDSLAGGYDAFVTVLSADGAALV